MKQGLTICIDPQLLKDLDRERNTPKGIVSRSSLVEALVREALAARRGEEG